MRRLFAIIGLMMSAMFIADAQTGTWSGKIDVQGTEISIVFHLDEDKPTVDSPDQGVKGIPVQIERGDAGKVTVRIPAIAATFEGQWLFNRIVGTFNQMNVDFPLTLTPGENKPKRPQTPSGPFPYTTEDITFTNDGIRLNGTLVLPEGYSRETPVLIMVTGSGQQNRDEELFDHKPFAVIADALARAGIATLRYDDRGFGDSSANPMEWTVEDFKSDALAVISLLRERFDKVGVIGHSEGGTIAMMIAAEHKADFIISLAGMAVSGAETLVWQNRIAFGGLGFSDEIIDSYCQLLETAFNVRVHGGRMPDPADYNLPESLIQNYWAVVAQIQLPYMRYFLSLDIRPLLGEITCPVLALNGAKDNQVDHTVNLNAIRSGLTSDPKNRIASIEDLNHLFQHCRTGAVTEYRMIKETFAPEVLTMIIQWISDLK
ncbi:MAG: alpha/beta fold hydrolase [Bacteroidales bacterium]|nr:alpha/beta fold hydrolase [Bacteroidales bacterium]